MIYSLQLQHIVINLPYVTVGDIGIARGYYLHRENKTRSIFKQGWRNWLNLSVAMPTPLTLIIKKISHRLELILGIPFKGY